MNYILTKKGTDENLYLRDINTKSVNNVEQKLYVSSNFLSTVNVDNNWRLKR